MSKDIIAVHIRLTKEQHQMLKEKKGSLTWEEWMLKTLEDNHA
jgi:hypothetical protein